MKDNTTEKNCSSEIVSMNNNSHFYNKKIRCGYNQKTN